MWLTTFVDVVHKYGGRNDIDIYKLPEKYIVISDLGPEGVLFVSNEPFALAE